MKQMKQQVLAVGLLLSCLAVKIGAQNNVAMQDSIPEIVVTYN